MLLSVLAVSPYTGLQSGTVPATVAHLVMSHVSPGQGCTLPEL